MTQTGPTLYASLVAEEGRGSPIMRVIFLSRWFLPAALSLGMMTTASGNPCQIQASGSAKIVLPQVLPGQAHLSVAELFAKVIERHHWQEARIVRLSSVQTYKLEHTKSTALAEEVVNMQYTAPGTDTFAIASGAGSPFIRHHVFQRILKDEEKRVKANSDPDSLISPKNYTFEIIGEDHIGSSECTVVHAIPKRRETDLFEGKIWIDERDFAIVKIVGHLSKSPSLWIKRVDFVRQYQKIDEYWLPLTEEASVDVRVYGAEILTIDYHDYTVNTVETASTSSSQNIH